MITKGKWVLLNDQIVSLNGDIIAQIPFRAIDNYDTESEDKKYNRELESDMYAISAVPDMIEVLKEVALFGFTYCIDADADRYRVSIPIETRDKITAALEKAGII
jgi:hypothetical protein